MFIDFTPPPEMPPAHSAFWEIACCQADDAESEQDPGVCETEENPGPPPDDDMTTTMALGEEGGEAPTPGKPKPIPGNPLGPTTLALGEEGGEGYPPLRPR